MRPRRRSRRSWPILMERFFKIAFRDVLFWKRCVKCTDLDSDGHIRNGYGQESSKPDRYVSVQIRPMLDLNSDSLYGLDWTSMDFGQNHLKSWIGLYGLLWKERRARSRPLNRAEQAPLQHLRLLRHPQRSTFQKYRSSRCLRSRLILTRSQSRISEQ